MTLQNEKLSELLTVRITPSLLEALHRRAQQFRLPYQHIVRQILAEAVAESNPGMIKSANEKIIFDATNKDTRPCF